jgi:hypothetical protein
MPHYNVFLKTSQLKVKKKKITLKTRWVDKDSPSKTIKKKIINKTVSVYCPIFKKKKILENRNFCLGY